MLPLSSNLKALPGIAEERQRALAEAGIKTVEDLLWGLPYRYIDRGSIAPIESLMGLIAAPEAIGSIVTIQGRIADLRQTTSRIKKMPITEVLLDDSTGTARLVWFNQPYLFRAFKLGQHLLAWGPLVQDRLGPEMHSPDWEILSNGSGGLGTISTNAMSEARANGMDANREGSTRTASSTAQPPKSGDSRPSPPAPRHLPLYRRIGKISGRARQKAVQYALNQIEAPESLLPPQLSKGLPGTLDAFRMLHAPPDASTTEELNQRISPAHQRLAAEELFAFALGLEMHRQSRIKRPGHPVPTTPELREKLKTFLPFPLTTAQRRAFKEIVGDISSGRVMHRILQGDVGSGKTLVALLAMAMVAETGGQAALLVPTEVLAKQHAATFAKLLGPGGHPMQVLTGSMKTAERRAALAAIEEGTASYIIGTHAIIQESVAFQNLQMVVVDEQQRFGVAQRESIRGKGPDPHWLVMTATPIPRSLALALFGDLDQSVLDELPPGRQPIETRLIGQSHIETAWQKIEQELAKGHQAYVVSPAINSNQECTPHSLRDLQTMEATLQSRFPGTPIAIAHGRLKPSQLTASMEKFVSGQAKILIATTVIEVGVDVPNATIMAVDHAERFGLSQLHQLRGRVGRGPIPSQFIMVSDSDTARLKALVETSDGFRIALKDLEIRGPGEFFGTRQSGLPQFQVADLIRHRYLLQQCRDAASKAVSEGITEAQRRWLHRSQSRLNLIDIS